MSPEAKRRRLGQRARRRMSEGRSGEEDSVEALNEGEPENSACSDGNNRDIGEGNNSCRVEAAESCERGVVVTDPYDPLYVMKFPEGGGGILRVGRSSVGALLNQEVLREAGRLNSLRLSNPPAFPGDCMYATIGECMRVYGLEYSVAALRGLAYRYLKTPGNETRLRRLWVAADNGGRSYEEFCRLTVDAKAHEYGNQFVLVGLADRLGIRIRVLSATDGVVSEMPVIGEDGPVICLGFSSAGGGHYYSLLPREVGEVRRNLNGRKRPAEASGSGSGKRSRPSVDVSDSGPSRGGPRLVEKDGEACRPRDESGAEVFRPGDHRLGCVCEACLSGLAGDVPLDEPFPAADEVGSVEGDNEGEEVVDEVGSVEGHNEVASELAVSGRRTDVESAPSGGPPHCENCWRSDTDEVPLDLVVVEKSRRGGRTWGHLKRREGVFRLCHPCERYLDRGNDKRHWRFSWPSVLFSLLFESAKLRLSAGECGHVWESIPSSLRESWNWASDSLSPGVTQSVGVEPKFKDRTQELARFWSFKNPSLRLDWKHELDVKCVLGCDTFIDETKRIPFQHYLALIVPSLSAFGADRTKLMARRPNWPKVEVDPQLGYEKWPSLIHDPVNGLCVMICNEHGQLSKRMVHAPEHPVKDIGAVQMPDRLSSVTMCGDVVQSGRSGDMTTSSPMFRVGGGHGGLSCMYLGPQRGYHSFDSRVGAAEKLSLQRRDDVRYFARNSDSLGEEFVNSTLGIPTTVSDLEIRGCLEGASYVPQEVAYYQHKRRANRDVRREVMGDVVQVEDLYNGVMVHPYGVEGGMTPEVNTSTWFRDHRGGPLNPSLLWFVSLIVHYGGGEVRVSERFGAGDAEKLVKASNNHDVKGQSLSAGEARRLNEALEGFADVEEEALLVEKLMEMEDVFRNVEVVRGVEGYAGDKDTSVVIRSHAGSTRRNEMPLNCDDSTLRLVYCPPRSYGGETDHTVYLRWSGTHKFWKWTKGGGVVSVEELPGDAHRYWALAIYRKETAVMAEARRVFWEHLGGQSVVECRDHLCYLVREPMGSALYCGLPNCARKAFWRCPKGAGDMQCRSAMCRQHGKEAIDGRGVRLVSASGLVQLDDPAEELGDAFLQWFESHVEEDEEEELLDEVDQVMFAPEEEDDEGTPGASYAASDSADLYSRLGMDLHVLLNKYCSVMRRKVAFYDSGRSGGLMQYMHSTSTTTSIPLLYPEGLLFPTHFFASEEGSVVGAIPSFLYFLHQDLGHFRPHYMSLLDHFRARIKNNQLSLAQNQYYIMSCFSTVVNVGLNYSSSKIVCRRGFECLCQGRNSREVETAIAFDEISAQTHVKNLSALQRRDLWNYFVTVTCNDSGTPGVGKLRDRVISEWMSSDRPEKYDLEEWNDVVDAAMQTVTVPLTRAWYRFGRHLVDYLLRSEDHVLGDIKYLWLRFEFQDARGNRPHMHFGVSLKPKVDGCRESAEEMLRRICCIPEKMYSEEYGTDVDSLVEKGIVEDEDGFERLLELNVFNWHDCAKASQKCLKRVDVDGNLRCRVARHPVSVDDTYEGKDDLYTEEEMATLASVSLCENGEVHEDLRGGRYHYANTGVGVPLPTVPLLAAICRSSTNVQVTDRRFNNAYLTKYAAGQDEKQKVYMRNVDEDGGVEVVDQGFVHEKISGSRFVARVLEGKKKEKNEWVTRKVCVCEGVWNILGCDYVMHNVEFVNVSTLPPEYRSAVLRNRNAGTRVTGEGGVGLAAVDARVRLGLPEWRKFSENQIRHMNQYLTSKFTLDKVTSFSVRPPELRFVDNIEDYYRFFDFVQRPSYKVDGDLMNCAWMDGTLRQVYLRSTALNEFVSYVSERAERDMNVAELKREVIDILGDSSHASHLGIRNRFIAEKSTDAIVVFNPVTPENPIKFLMHLCYSLGRFETEFDLLSNTGGSIRRVLQRAGLLPDPGTLDSARELVKKYVLDQLQYYASVKRKQLVRYIELAKGVLEGLVENDEIFFEAVPVAAEDEMRLNAVANVVQTENDLGLTLREGLVRFVPDFNPDVPLNWRPVVGGAENQTAASLAEQTDVLNRLLGTVDHFVEPANTFTRGAVVLGVPGAGKTVMMMKALAYAKSRGLKTYLTSVAAERSRELGGLHLHRLFPIPVMNSMQAWPRVIAMQVIDRLVANPLQLALLLRMQVLGIEEIGIMAGELLSVIDEVLRFIRGSNLPFGGVLVLATGDPGQLETPGGRSVFTNPHLLTSLRVMKMRELVRAGGDADLGSVIEIMRRSASNEDGQMTDVDIATVMEILDRRLSGNVRANVAGLDEDIIFVVGKRIAEAALEAEFMVRKKEHCEANGIAWVEVEASDRVQNSANDWGAASAAVSQRLDRAVLTRKRLLLYQNAVVRLTENSRQGSAVTFSQGQLAIVHVLPDLEVAGHEQTLTLRLLPPGVRQADVDVGNLQEIVVRRTPSYDVMVRSGMQLARREQFPVRLNASATAHKVLGSTLERVAFKVSADDRTFSLWDRKQVLVILSRVRSLDHVFPIGEWQDIRRAIVALLRKPYPFDKHIHDFLDDLNEAGVQGTPRVTSLVPRLVPIPGAEVGYVYILVSLNRRPFDRTYVGETVNLRRRLNEHQRGTGDQGVGPEFRPFSLYGFVVGFRNVGERKRFESDLHRAMRQSQEQNNRPMRVDEVFEEADRLRRDLENPESRIVQCAFLRHAVV